MTEDNGGAGRKAEPAGARGTECRDATRRQEPCAGARVMSDQGRDRGTREPGGAGGMMGHGGVEYRGSVAGGRDGGSSRSSEAGDCKTGGESSTLQGANCGCTKGLTGTSEGRADESAGFSRGGGRESLGSHSGNTGNSGLDGTCGNRAFKCIISSDKSKTLA